MKLEIDKVVYGGQGLARVPADQGPQSGMRVFVPFTLPGEEIEAEIAEQRRGYLVGDVEHIERASEFRIEAPCPWFGTCGGCQLQHGTYAYQVQLKREMLAESLTRAGLRELPEITSLAGEPFAYRNRIRLRIETRPEFAIGYRQSKSHRIVAIDHCPVAMALVQECIATVRMLGMQGAVPPDAEEVEIFTNHDESELLLTLWTRRRSDAGLYTEFFTRMHSKIPQLTGAAVILSDRDSHREPRFLQQWGPQHLRYRAAEREYTVSLGSFFQVNGPLLDRFVAASSDVEGGEKAWDLYAGVGLFSRALAERFGHVLAVESSPPAAKDLHKNLQGASATAVRATTLEFLQKSVRRKGQGPSPDLVLLDPPRAGAGLEVCRLLGQCEAKRIVYVSCDPATLGRDLTALIQSGYRLLSLQLVDMFPQTGHLEAIAKLER